MTALTANHRRERQQTRRALADLRIRWRDLSAPAVFRTELYLLDGRDRLVTHASAFARSRA
jgi:hypothetical protein